ncbi:hypothetical protein TNIN_372481, partial [Trichonephila inaurata madagascariensis]
WLAVITGERGHTAGYFSSVCEETSAQVPYFLPRNKPRDTRRPRTARAIPDTLKSEAQKWKISFTEMFLFKLYRQQHEAVLRKSH